MFEKTFKLSSSNSNIKTEFIAGITTFLTAAYIIFVNPDILSATGMDKGALITVTALITGLSCIMVGLFTNLPFMMAPGMGLNAFFAFSLCIGKGIPWETTLGIVSYQNNILSLLNDQQRSNKLEKDLRFEKDFEIIGIVKRLSREF